MLFSRRICHSGLPTDCFSGVPGACGAGTPGTGGGTLVPTRPRRIVSSRGVLTPLTVASTFSTTRRVFAARPARRSRSRRTLSAIILLGGSTAWGAQGSFGDIDNRYSRIYNNQLIDAYLEQKLSAAVPSRHWEVINAAASGYRIHQRLMLLESRILRYHPDCVILLDGYNDVMTLFHAAALGGQSDFDVYGSTAGLDEFDAIFNSRSFSALLAFSHSWVRSNSALIRLAEDRVPGLVRNPWRGAPRNHPASANPATLGDLEPTERKGADWALREASFFPGWRARSFASPISMALCRSSSCNPSLSSPTSNSRLPRSGCSTMTGHRAVRSMLTCSPRPTAISPDRCAEAAQMDGFSFVNLETVFDGSADQTFTDFAHLTPGGNEIIAERLGTADSGEIRSSREMIMTTHEDFTPHHRTAGPSDFSFGLTAAAVFTVAGLWPLLHHQPVRLWALVLGGVCLCVACAKPGLLRSANRMWMQLGLAINRLVTPNPDRHLLFRGGDAASRVCSDWRAAIRFGFEPDPDAPTYWIERLPAGPPPQSMEQQF